ncbi:hypothetical protein PsYK624_141950 [Phanerochaete sordida]|uniref:Uncharacterized protein n=1 Tax=Phanerochaete sordida TaxID=48140 RepID=A0A9P3GN40_9APHY|nr:hypothetical protein PsYK624_141950 [Phanerochaete sordida]
MPPTRTKTKPAYITPSESQWMYKTKAMKTYKLSVKDLESITPISVDRNPYGGRNAAVRYSVRDLESLARRLHGDSFKTPFVPPKVELAKPCGDEILHSRAKDVYSMTNDQLKAIKPVRVEPNPHGGPYPMKHYNVCDVEALAKRLGLTAKLPVQPRNVPAPVASSSRGWSMSDQFSHDYGYDLECDDPDYDSGADDSLLGDEAED